MSAIRYGKVAKANATSAYRVAYSSASQLLLVGSRSSSFTFFNYNPNSLGGAVSGNVAGGNIFTLTLDANGGTGYAGTNGGVYQLNTNGTSNQLNSGTRTTGLFAAANDLVAARPNAGTLRRMTYGGTTIWTSAPLNAAMACPGGSVTLGNPTLVAVDTGDLVYTVTDTGYLAQFSTDVQTCNWNVQLAGISNTVANDTLAIRANTDLWVTAGTNGVYVYNLSGTQLSGSPIAVPYAQDVVFSPNGAYAFVTNPNVGQVAVINTSTRAIVGQYDVAGGRAEYLAALNAVVTGLQPKVRFFLTDGASVFQTQ